MKTALVIGGGFAGCAAAHQLVLMGGWDVTIVESAPFLGAGVRTFWYGGHPYTFGPRHFLTQNEAVFDYLNTLLPLRRCPEHEFYTYVESDNAFYNFPIHMDDIERMPDRDLVHAELKQAKGVGNAKNLEEYWVGSVGKTLYRKYIENYNKKMWMVDDNTRIDTFNWSPKGVAIKEGPRACWDTAISAYPYAPDGYNAYFDIATQGVRILLSTTVDVYDIPAKTVVIKGETQRYDVIVNTISPDLVFGSCYGELGYIGRDLHKLVFPTEHVFPENVYFLYYANEGERFTRMVEYKKFTRHQSPTTLVGLEIPSFNGRHYPLPFQSEIAKARRYHELMPDGVYSIGRAGTYRYGLDIDDCIEQAIEMARQIREGGRDFAVPVERWRD